MINLFYYNSPNLGDQLSKYIVEKMSKDKVRYCNPFSYKKLFYNYLSAAKQLLTNNKERIPALLAFSHNRVFIAVGSLLEHSTKSCVCWGTGMAQPNMVPKGGTFLMTRGYKSRDVLTSAGFHVESEHTGDLALLMPLLYSPTSKRKMNRIGIIPHVSEFDDIKTNIAEVIQGDVVFLDFRTDEIEKTLDLLNTCSFVYSSSLHGIILSHAYGIPCIRFKKKELGGGDFKFEDYFSSVGIEPYTPLTIEDVENGRRIDSKSTEVAPSTLEIIQKELLRVSPFK